MAELIILYFSFIRLLYLLIDIFGYVLENLKISWVNFKKGLKHWNMCPLYEEIILDRVF